MRHVGETGVKPVLCRNCNHETMIESWKPEYPLDDRSGTFERKGRGMKNLHDLSPLSCDKGVLFACLLDRGSQANVTPRRRTRHLVRAVFSCLVLAILTVTVALTPAVAAQSPAPALSSECHVHGAEPFERCAALTSNTWPARMAAAARALNWLHTQQQPDGSFGARTADAVYIIGRAGENPDGPAWQPGSASALDALQSQVPAYLTDAGRTAKFLRAVAATGQDVHHVNGVDLVARVSNYYNPSTGLYHPGHLYYHTLAVQALRLAGQPVPAPAVSAILNLQHPTGGWEWRIGGPLDEVDTTGLILETLPLAAVPITSTTVMSAVNFLATTQHADGGWSLNATGATNSNSTALALAGLLTAGRNPLAAPFVRGQETPLSALLALQAADGGFNFMATAAGERLMATLDALDALLRPYPGDVLPPARVFLPLVARY